MLAYANMEINKCEEYFDAIENLYVLWEKVINHLTATTVSQQGPKPSVIKAAETKKSPDETCIKPLGNKISTGRNAQQNKTPSLDLEQTEGEGFYPAEEESEKDESKTYDEESLDEVKRRGAVGNEGENVTATEMSAEEKNTFSNFSAMFSGRLILHDQMEKGLFNSFLNFIGVSGTSSNTAMKMSLYRVVNEACKYLSLLLLHIYICIC
jgi:hypothetical protein